MSSGPGRVERAIRALLEAKQSTTPANHRLTVTTEALCQAAYGDGPWTKAHRVSALRAMRRIIAALPTKTERERWKISQPKVESDWRKKWLRERGEWQRDRWLRFVWTPPTPASAKPQKVHEVIWACEEDYATGRYTWSEAVIISRGGSDPKRISIRWGGRTWQGWESTWRGNLGDFELDVPEWGLAAFVRPPTGRHRKLEFWRDRKEGEAWNRENRDFRRKLRAATNVGTASATDWEMLDLRPGASAAQIKQAFKTKALKAHPDHGGDNAIMRALKMARDACLADADD